MAYPGSIDAMQFGQMGGMYLDQTATTITQHQEKFFPPSLCWKKHNSVLWWQRSQTSASTASLLGQALTVKSLVVTRCFQEA